MQPQNPEENNPANNIPVAPQNAGGQVINPTAAPATPAVNQPDVSPNTGFTPPAFNSQVQTINQPPEPKKSSKKRLITIVVAGLLLVGGAAAGAYFGYYVPNKPENIWRTALVNTGKGYDKLSEYATAKKDVKSMKATGKYKVSGDFATDGTFEILSDGKNGQFTGSASMIGLKIDYDVRAIESAGNSPDIYFKINGIQDLGDLAGSFGADKKAQDAINGLNDKWYFIDHSLFDNFAKESNSTLDITSGDVDSLLKGIGDPSKKYLFTNNSQNMAFEVRQNVGKEKQDGRDVYHYKVGLNKDNLKKWNKEVCDSIKDNKVYKLANGSLSQAEISKQCYDTKDIDGIDSSKTADVWVDLKTRLIHKVKFPQKNPGDYFEISQNYTGGDEFPFALGFMADDNGIKSKGTIDMKLNMKTNVFTVNAKLENSGKDDSKGTFDLTVTPTNEPVNVEKPKDAKTIIQLLNDLGLGQLLNPSEPQPSKIKVEEN